ARCVTVPYRCRIPPMPCRRKYQGPPATAPVVAPSKDPSARAIPGTMRGTPALTAADGAVRDALRRRGLRWNGERDPTPLLVPRTAAARARHPELLGHYSYRLFLRDVLKQPADLHPARLARYVTPAVAARYLRE